MTDNKEINELLENSYIPSASERKRCVIMYFLIGIIITINKNGQTKYEIFHLKQSIGWWLIFFLSLVVILPLSFLPFIGWLPILFLVLMLAVLGYFVKQANEGTYVTASGKMMLPIFHGLGTRVVDLFDLVSHDETEDKSNKEKTNE